MHADPCNPHSASGNRWRICIEAGGTFTDCVAVSPKGEVRRAKVLSNSVGTSGEPATVLAARLVMQTPEGSALPPARVRLATTRATNALLERRLTPTLLLVSEGFGDLLEIGDQRRPRLFELAVRKPPALHAGVVEVRGRLDAGGRVLQEVDIDGAVAAARTWLARGIRSAAIALMHSWRDPSHELRLAAALREAGFTHVSCSADLSPRIRIVPRARTAVVNAALFGSIESFIAATRDAWTEGQCDLEVMTSAGGLTPASDFRPVDSLLSGPAGGVSGAAAAGRRAGLERIIAFDMGGTSTDVTRIDRDAELSVTHRVGDVEMMAPALAVHSVAAGGGSICDLEIVQASGGKAAVRVIVGPRSAGADPGPACYGRGGPLTVTDVNLLLGRLDAASFAIPIHTDAARRQLAGLRDRAAAAGADVGNDQSLLEAFIAIANQRMATAIQTISVRKGYDPRDYAIVAFGGAGGQHACAIAHQLGVSRILIPADCSVLSALGLHAAQRRIVREEQTLRTLSDGEWLHGAMERLTKIAREDLEHQGDKVEAVQRVARVRYAGQDHAFEIEWSEPIDVGLAFQERSRATFGHVIAGRSVEVESIRVVVASSAGAIPFAASAWSVAGSADSGGAAQSLPSAGVSGPALVLGAATTVFVEQEWHAKVTADGDLLLAAMHPTPRSAEREPDAENGRDSLLRQELIAGRLESLGEAMGELLGRTAISTNVKERLDYSCALVDARGELVVSAPHLPVHLGALGVCVRELRNRIKMQQGDVVITNHPAFGGSHLPDITLVAPSHDDRGELIGFAVCRAHHAEVGGTRPGSMPPDATRLEEEGVVIPPAYLVRAGEAQWTQIRDHFASARFPTRAIEENMADLGAQLAAVRMGVAGLSAAARAWSSAHLAEVMELLKARADAALRAAIGLMIEGTVSQSTTMDDGSVLRVAIERRDHRLRIDFSGSAGVHPGNLNAPRAVIHSATMYVMRLLIDRALDDAPTRAAASHVPLNDGLMRSIDLILPPGMLNPPWESLGGDSAKLPAVAGGNVETSQQVVNLLLGAIGLCADSQGTMNNLLFGNQRLGYYETIGGGTGAGPGFDGASGVHSHMSNTAITDPEILEHRYPVRLERFAIRRGSGGSGKHRGGDGLVRRITFIEPLSVSLLTSNRVRGPRGLGGGSDGAPGSQHVLRADGSTQKLRPLDGFDAAAGDVLEIKTPGGGGFGTAG